MKKIILIFLLTAFVPLLADAQVVVERSKETVTVGGVEYYMHHVKQGETLYSISKAYHVSIEEITRKNPEVNDGLKAEMVIGIPVADFSEEETQPAQNVVENKVEEPHETNTDNGTYTFSKGENLYTIAKKFGIDLADFKTVNPGLTNEPAEGTVIYVPLVRNEEEYLVHKVEMTEKTSSLLRKWKVDEDTFRTLNPAVGSHVFSNQVVLIPIEKVEFSGFPAVAIDDDGEEVKEEPEEQPVESDTEPVAVEDEPEPIAVEDEPLFASDCEEMAGNAKECYKVALLIPLYLGEVNDIAVSPESVVKSKKARPFSFLQFYEGFMIAVDSLKRHCGLQVDLQVIDVTENIGTAQNALSHIESHPVDLIVGPFFSKSFGVVQEYAKEHRILIVNPLSTRENIVEDNPYVVKLKPSSSAQLSQLACLINKYYGDSNVSIVCQKSLAETSSEYLDEMERLLNMAVKSEVMLTAEDFMRYAQEEARRQQKGVNLPPTIEVEGQFYATKDVENGELDNVKVPNSVWRYVYGTDDMNDFNQGLSSVRNNVVIAYGNSNVFATQILNRLNKTAEIYKITLVAMPDWSDLDKLLVENLLKLNAIYFSDVFVDYNQNAAKRFVLQFRKKYRCEPTEYAFSGFDAAWYFLNAFMRYGHEPKDCLLNLEMPLLSNSFRFVKTASDNGLENYQWSIYQYDNEDVELKPVNLSETVK